MTFAPTCCRCERKGVKRKEKRSHPLGDWPKPPPNIRLTTDSIVGSFAGSFNDEFEFALLHNHPKGVRGKPSKKQAFLMFFDAGGGMNRFFRAMQYKIVNKINGFNHVSNGMALIFP
jgi:hypothetical protein